MPGVFTFQNDKDSKLLSDAPSSNYGTSTDLVCVTLTSDNSQAIRGILHFSIPSLGTAEPMQSATLSLYHYNNGANYDTARIVYVRKVTRNNWTELGATWQKYDGVNSWKTAGGDFVTSNPAQASATAPVTAGAWLDFDITAIVQDAFDNVDRHVNLIIMRTAGIMNNDDNFFYSRDYSDSSLRPKLTISVRIPSPNEMARKFGITPFRIPSKRLISYV